MIFCLSKENSKFSVGSTEDVVMATTNKKIKLSIWYPCHTSLFKQLIITICFIQINTNFCTIFIFFVEMERKEQDAKLSSHPHLLRTLGLTTLQVYTLTTEHPPR